VSAYEHLVAQIAAREANEASGDWRCPGCALPWDDLPVGHHWTYADGGSCGTTKPVSPAEFMASMKEQP
jgi:hypothetical protein